jgi:hypothetical protein
VPVGGEREFLAEFGLELREAFMIGGEESLKRFVRRISWLKRWLRDGDGALDDGPPKGGPYVKAAPTRNRPRAWRAFPPPGASRRSAIR